MISHWKLVETPLILAIRPALGTKSITALLQTAGMIHVLIIEELSEPTTKRKLARYRQMHHPRWGEIVGIFTTKQVREGEEFLCNYGYDIEKHLVPPWYKEAWAEFYGKTISTNKQG